ncbi:MAG: endonuclease/exonuclease/phosphatase family protein [Candidatus Marinimicrobia bacterium]|nr:endonuclease/exonuclease/phosphatase family protein [Candidatus Neomarinimicrobiota bacterium]
MNTILRFQKFYTCIILFGLLIRCPIKNDSDDTIRLMSFNIRLNTPSDSLNAWPYRKTMVASLIRFHKVDILGVQEALWDQMQDLENLLPEYAWVGIGRDDGNRAGEFMAIFYLKERFKVIKSSNFWLSENPEIPGKGWDAACNRIVTWCKFKDQKTGKIFFHFNTHFDHLGDTARVKSAELLIRQIDAIAGSKPVLVTGDFNSTPESKTYSILTNRLGKSQNLRLTDTKKVTRFPHHGSNGTFTWFDLNKLTNDQAIDHIFIKNGVTVLYHGTLTDTFDGRFPSDHFPVLTEIILN